METKKKTSKKNFDTVRSFRKIKDNISKDLKGMSFEEIKAYLKRESSKLRTQ